MASAVGVIGSLKSSSHFEKGRLLGKQNAASLIPFRQQGEDDLHLLTESAGYNLEIIMIMPSKLCILFDLLAQFEIPPGNQ
jgi:hypothetical protein